MRVQRLRSARLGRIRGRHTLAIVVAGLEQRRRGRVLRDGGGEAGLQGASGACGGTGRLGLDLLSTARAKLDLVLLPSAPLRAAQRAEATLERKARLES
jgi:hypothetical protein